MQKIFEKYGGVITTAMAIVAIIGVIALMFAGNGNGWMENGFKNLTTGFSNKTTLAINGPKIIDGAGQVYNTTKTKLLSFRSSAEIDDFEEVQIDGVVVDSSNYTVTEGSTIVTFDEEYSTTLSNGEHDIAVVSKTGTASASFTAIDAYTLDADEVVPEGCQYWQNSICYKAGESMPTVAYNDIFSTSDYKYTYSTEGWKVKAQTTKSKYEEIFENINGKAVTNMNQTFSNCTSLTTAPVIPSSVTNMSQTFLNCKKLTSSPTIPSSVTNMYGTFQGCTSLATTPDMSNATSVTSLKGAFDGCTSLTDLSDFVIPSSVTDMERTFYACTSLTDLSDFVIPSSVTNMAQTFGACRNLTTAPVIPSSVMTLNNTFYACTSLTGDIEINAASPGFYNCFSGTVKPITITGSCGNKAALAATATNGNVTY